MQKLTVGEAAERLQISEQAVRKRLQRGTLPHAKQDGHVYVYLDSETSTVGQKEGKESDRQTTLNYLDKVYTAYQAISGGYNRFAFLMLAVSVVVLALSGGAVSTADELTVSGIGLRIPFVVFMTTGAILPAIFIVIIGNLEWLRFVYRRDIDRIYENLKLDDLSWNLPADPFTLVGVLDAVGYTFAEESPTRDDRNRPVGTTALKPRGAGPIYI
jgi:helix-turn-helix protein